MQVTTESGAVYEFTKDGRKVRRLKNRNELDPDAEVPRANLRQDGKWLTLFKEVEPQVGYPMTLLVEPLNAEQVGMTLRQTSVVVGVTA